ncbi:MAG: hypothetical protein QG635_861, partial [Bacteroidota bacterium]|nr:hypothetical protein [Bacteroidota bacterium]
MKIRRLSAVILYLLIIPVILMSQKKFEVQKITDAKGYQYETVSGDALKLRIYTLQNGLKVYLRQNTDEPRIQTLIAVKAGSTYDPPNTTGLAHYLEHMMFKGTSRLGTTNWESEKKLLAQISDLFEKRMKTVDTNEKNFIYAQIDSISLFASKVAVGNEYDKLVNSMGAKGTNAFTSNERTVYINDIPANEMERWLKIESERFSELVLRLFHTELEAVYEEFNMSQDRDGEKVDVAMMSNLFKKHPYGTQTTIGKAEHLKNPSMVNIHNYWNTYYVPNNMAVCMSGDIDFDKTIALIDKYFGNKKPGNVPKFVPPVEDPIKEPIYKTVVGPDEESVNIGFRTKGYNTSDRKFCSLIDYMLNNSTAGLLDLDLIQKQKILSGGTYFDVMIDYGVFSLYGNPREGQTLEEVKDLLLGEIEKIKKGEFEDWLVPAVINNFKLNRIKSEESNYSAFNFMTYFTNGASWLDYVKFNDELDNITKQDIIRFANETFQNNYVVVYKRNGKDTASVKVPKPKITPVELNRESQSDFYKEITNFNSERLQPVFVDYNNAIKKVKLDSDVELNIIENITNELFSLNYILDMGGNHDKKLPIAVEFLEYLGTDKYQPEDFKKELYKLGISFGVYSGEDRSYISISGLDMNFEKGLELMEHLLSKAKPDQEIYDDFVESLLKKRTDAKLDKWTILWSGMFNYGMYGKNNPFTNVLSEKELRAIKPSELTNIIKKIFSFRHYAFYYGRNPDAAVKLIKQYHKTPSILAEYPPDIKFRELDINKSIVYFVNYDMVQNMLLFLAKDMTFDKGLIPETWIFNEYYGGSMSSIVFQDIREAKGLAYTAFASYLTPDKPDKSHYIYGFVTTQPDKLKDASDAFNALLQKMPKTDVLFQASKDAIQRKIESERIIKSRIFWNCLNNKDIGINYDNRKDVYEKAKAVKFEELEQF